MEDITGTSGTSGGGETPSTSVKTQSKPRKKRAKALTDAECPTCKRYGWDKETLDAKIKDMSKVYTKNQVASMLRVHSQYVDEVMSK